MFGGNNAELPPKKDSSSGNSAVTLIAFIGNEIIVPFNHDILTSCVEPPTPKLMLAVISINAVSSWPVSAHSSWVMARETVQTSGGPHSSILRIVWRLFKCGSKLTTFPRLFEPLHG